MKLGLIANAKRLMILCQLLRRETGAGELAEIAGLSQSALSQHLSRLRAASIVVSRREGKAVLYRMSDPEVTSLMATLCEIHGTD